MSVQVYPYITNQINSVNGKTNRTKSPVTQSDQRTNRKSFEAVFAETKRCEQQMAVDALIAQRKGGVTVETVRNLLGFDPAPGSIVANSKMNIEIPTMENQDPTGSQKLRYASGTTSDGTEAVDTSKFVKMEREATMEELNEAFADAAEKYNVDEALLKAIAFCESNFHSNAGSPVGAMGVMMLMPAAAKDYGVENPFDAYENVMGGARIIADHLERYDGDLTLALAAYNAGPGNVDKYGGVPPFDETQRYVVKVQDKYEEYKNV